MNLEPEKMLYITATVAVYGAILSTVNCIRDLRKDKIQLKVTATDGLLSSSPTIPIKSIYIINHSSFEIEITGVGFLLSTFKKKMFFPLSDFYQLPDNVSSKKARTYPIPLKVITKKLLDYGIDGKISLKPFVTVNGKDFIGKSFMFEPRSRDNN